MTNRYFAEILLAAVNGDSISEIQCTENPSIRQEMLKIDYSKDVVDNVLNKIKDISGIACSDYCVPEGVVENFCRVALGLLKAMIIWKLNTDYTLTSPSSLITLIRIMHYLAVS